MNKIQRLSQGMHHSAIDIGGWQALADFRFRHQAVPFQIEGKVFVNEALEMTGGILSLNVLAPFQSMPFFHQHHRHEEIYLIIAGQGEFMIDDARFLVSPGCVVRAAPQAVRCWRNFAAQPLYYAVLQIPEGAQKQLQTIEDGFAVKQSVCWD